MQRTSDHMAAEHCQDIFNATFIPKTQEISQKDGQKYYDIFCEIVLEIQRSFIHETSKICLLKQDLNMITINNQQLFLSLLT